MSRRLVVLTGLSGSGKSTGARALEDAGFFVVDNLPLPLLPDFLALTDRGYRHVAVVVDARSRDFLSGAQLILADLKNSGTSLEVLFFEAADEELVRRFSETRRRHPLVQQEGIAGAIRQERELMAELKRAATVILDSSETNVHQLRQKVLTVVFGPEQETNRLAVQLVSFGYRYGLPLEADLVFDVRFLDNPHFVPELRPLTGRDPQVSHFVLSQPDCQEFIERVKDLLFFQVPRCLKEGKSALTIAVGCTGGRHRSVAVVEELRPYLLGTGCAVEVIHRDADRSVS
ncbi:MAG: RNase adapter RapZ [Desulfuromonadales bacterium]|nr:RNase adapter RapZ [Desulfuromonadales bacterium]